MDALDEISDITYMRKNSNYRNPAYGDVQFRPIIDRDFNFRINIKEEEYLEINDIRVQSLLSEWTKSNKSFRYKKRYSFVTPDNLFSIDLTSVKSTGYNESFKSFLESNILKKNETYELEIEYIGSIPINDEFPIDKFKEKFYTDKLAEEKDRKEYHDSMKTGWDTMINKGNNTFSELVIPDIAPVDEELSNESREDEFSDEIYYGSEAAVKLDYSFKDIKYEYWVDSGKEWLFDALLTHDKSMVYSDKKLNFTGNYDNAPKNTEYIEYKIYPEFTEEEKEGFDEFGDYFNHNLYVPSEQIIKITEQKKSISWAPGKVKSIKYTNQESPQLVNDVKWSPEIEMFDDPPPLVTFEQLKEAGEFDEDIAVLEKVNEYKQKNNIPNNIRDITEGLIDVLKLNISEILKIKDNTDFLLNKKIKNRVIKEYKILTEQTESEFINRKRVELKKLVQHKSKKENPKKTGQDIFKLEMDIERFVIESTRFIGPNPVSISLNNIDPKLNHSIIEKYVVTEKADGIRSQLFIGSDKYGYLITQKMKVIGTNLKFNDISGTWLFDGEYITKNKNNDDISLFMIFDVYYAGDGNSKYPAHAHTYPWIGHKKDDISRYNILQDFQRDVDIDGDLSEMRIGYKSYLEGPKKLQKSKKNPDKYSNSSGIFKQSNKILELSDKNGYEYEIDGLIYMPMFLSVGAMEENVPNNFINGEWSINYKWKPPEENTIDFRVRFIKEEVKGKERDKIISSRVKGKTIVCKQVHLYVGYNIKRDLGRDFTLDILRDKNAKSLKEILFNPDKNKTLYICNIPLKNGKLICEKDNSEILNGNLVEMRYNPDSEDMRWTPLRVRTDKMGQDGGNAQFFIIANNIWNTIINPVTVDLIKGLDDISEITKDEAEEPFSYYVGSDMESRQDESLRKVHNYIKSKLIASVCSIGSNPISIMDTSTGRGGDLKTGQD